MKAFCLLGSIAGFALLAGCGMKGQMPQFGTAASQPAPPASAGAMAATPYALSAHCSGPFVSFSLENHGSTPMAVKRQHFAMVVPKTRKVVPYTEHSATIDLPRAEIGPGEKLEGRAWFKEVPAPTGNRLVYKPDGEGTFAEVSGPAGV